MSWRDHLPADVAAAAATVELDECTVCHSPTKPDELAAGICDDCRRFAARAAAPAAPASGPEFLALEIDSKGTPDELRARRELRQQVRQARDANPTGWLAFAMEAVRTECVRGRSGHEFTADTIYEEIERAHGPQPPEEHSMRFVLEQAASRGWCEMTDATQPSRRPELAGRRIRIWKSLL